MQIQTLGRLSGARWIPAIAAVVVLCGLGASDAAAESIARAVVNPILVRHDDGSSGVDLGSEFDVYQAATVKIWDQAGIQIDFLPWTYFDETDFLSIDNAAEFESLTTGAGHGQSSDALTINVFFVDYLYADPGYTAFGLAWTNGTNGVVVADETFSSSWNRYDTIAHEIGHNFGLGHDDYGAGGALNLMTAGSTRTIPTGLDDIFPDGTMTDQLTSRQIEVALASDFTQPVPEPSTMALLGVGVGALFVLRRRRRNAA